MQSDFNRLFGLVIIVHTVVVAILALFFRTSKDDRTRILWKLLLLQMVCFPAIIVGGLYFQYPTTILNLLSYIVYASVGAFVIGVEIPGFFLLSRFDARIVASLENIRNDLLPLGYVSPLNFSVLNNTLSEEKSILESIRLTRLVNDFVATCERIQNLDRPFWVLLLGELTRNIEFYADRSKHPSPKLIDVFSLAGLSFLLAQFLRTIG